MQRRFHSGRDFRQSLTIEELRAIAKRRLPAFALEYLEGGAEDEVTLRRNRMAFEALAFVSKTLVDVTRRDLSVEVFGETLPLPIAIAPTGSSGLFARKGDLALARAAAATGIPFIQSTVSTLKLETIAAEAGGRHWMQLYMLKDRAVTEAIVARAAKAGCGALVVTTDTVVFGNREWDRRHYSGPGELRLASKIDVLAHPRWILDVLVPHGMPVFENLLEFLPGRKADPVSTRAFLVQQMDTSITFADIAWLRRIWPRKLVVKGVLDADDARRAADAGADGIVVSNHGARQLDGAVSPMDVLPEIVKAAGEWLCVMVDGGFRRGTDIVKAVALGADLVLLGRATLYGLAAGGEEGVNHALSILREEIDRTVGLLGATNLRECRGRVRPASC
ncbi:(S)-mandelate dehydrogenase [Rhizobiales bacterium GAS191]|jgi:(S)-mandelate dehydrogenase|nr:(S)-mandelate dehydrogenase [Rhizobiales bacterium GAS113]SEE26523.1 (S)-mandelate dehydrogenase [Rhizobiales bacterium GAS191]